jgi:hypothetical protein
MRVLVTGSRDWRDREAVERALRRLEREALDGDGTSGFTLVHGGRRGADAHAHSWARNRVGWTVEPHPAAWWRYGRGAGPIRDREMVEAGADVCIAFLAPGSRGSRGCATLAAGAGIRVIPVYASEAS